MSNFTPGLVNLITVWCVIKEQSCLANTSFNEDLQVNINLNQVFYTSIVDTVTSLAKKKFAMVRMHTPGKGIAQSALPYKRSVPTVSNRQVAPSCSLDLNFV